MFLVIYEDYSVEQWLGASVADEVLKAFRHGYCDIFKFNDSTGKFQVLNNQENWEEIPIK